MTKISPRINLNFCVETATSASAAPTPSQVDSTTLGADALDTHAPAAINKPLGVFTKSISKDFFQ